MHTEFYVLLTFVVVTTAAAARPKHDRVRRLVNGDDELTAGWEFNAFINFRQPKPKWKICGASLVAKSWVLTLASCLEDIYMSPQHVTVGIGTRSLKDVSASHNFSVSQIVVHPDYILPHQRKKGEQFSIDNDVALMEISRPISDDIQPITLADTSDEITEAEDFSCHLTGYGANTPIKNMLSYIRKDYEISDRLKEIGVKLISKDSCIKKQKIATAKPNIYGKDRDLARIICGVSEEEKDQTTCLGDNGSPLVCSKGENRALFGLILRGDFLCRPGKSAIFFTEVAKHKEWIYRTIGKE